MIAVFSMAEDQQLAHVINAGELDGPKEGDDELYQLKEGDSDGVSLSSSDGDGDNGQRNESDDDQKQRKRRRQRRGKPRGKHHNYRKYHRPYRPYANLSLSERLKVDERIEKTALTRSENLFASGHPMAPFNTTQFLIEDHIKNNISPDLSNGPSPVQPQDVPGVEDEPEELPAQQRQIEEADNTFPATVTLPELQRDSGTPSVVAPPEKRRYDREFVATYEHVSQDRMYGMSKDDLIRLNASLERKCATMERALQLVRGTDGNRNESLVANSVSSSHEFGVAETGKRVDTEC